MTDSTTIIPEFLPLTEQYLDEVREIYNHYALHSTATFHAHAFSKDEMRDVVFFPDPKYKTFVLKGPGAIYGYAVISQHKKRESYDITAEVSVYLRPEHKGRGYGSLALRFIEQFAKTRGIHVLIGTICGENAESIKVFEKNGYWKCAHYREVGQKFGQLLDVVAYQKII